MRFFKERKVTGTQPYQSNQNQEDLSSLVSEYASLVKRIAEQIKRTIPQGLELDDLIQSGVIGLLEANYSYNTTHDASFKTYATMKIRYAIYESLRKHTGITREISQLIKQIEFSIVEIERKNVRVTSLGVAETLGVSPEKYARITEEINAFKTISMEDLPGDQECSGPQSQNPIFHIAQDKRRVTVLEVLNNLPRRDQLILSLYYQEFLSFKEIGQILELSEARISQIHAQLLIKLKSRLSEIEDSIFEIL